MKKYSAVDEVTGVILEISGTSRSFATKYMMKAMHALVPDTRKQKVRFFADHFTFIAPEV